MTDNQKEGVGSRADSQDATREARVEVLKALGYGLLGALTYAGFGVAVGLSHGL